MDTQVWTQYLIQSAHRRRTLALRAYTAGEPITPIEAQVLTALGFINETGLTAAGRAWLSDQGLLLEVADGDLHARLWPDTYCASILANQKRNVPAPVYYAGRYWLCTGGVLAADYHAAYAREVVAPAEFSQQYPDEPLRGPNEHYFGPHGYTGCCVTHGTQPWVMTERELVVLLANAPEVTLVAPPKQLSLFG